MAMLTTITGDNPSKREGDISNSFVSLSGTDQKPLPDKYRLRKLDLIRGHEQAVVDSWKSLLRRLQQETEEVAQRGSDVIPQIDAKELLEGLSDEKIEQVRRRGVVVVKGVVPEEEARGYKEEVEEYVRKNPHTKAFPQHDPQVYELYWSPPQLKARSHPSLVAVQKQLMTRFWHAEPSASISLSQPMSYADRLRIRQPGDASFALGPHMDGGSVERWELEGYGDDVYGSSIFRGRWETVYDAWDATGRVDAVYDTGGGLGACSGFRMWQGWLSMSRCGPGEGTLQVNPMLKSATAYLLLRPFFRPIDSTNVNNAGYLSEENWEFLGVAGMTSELQGATPGHGQELSEALHPHLRLGKTMVSIPDIRPGDYVAWHCDLIHAVDKIHGGTGDSSVLYIPVCPLTERNADYARRQRDMFRAGTPGPDFPGGEGESRHVGRPTEDTMPGGSAAKQSMGLEKLEVSPTATAGDRKAVEKANVILGFAR